MTATPWTFHMQDLLSEALSLPPADLSALVGELLARAPRSVLDEAREQLEAP